MCVLVSLSHMIPCNLLCAQCEDHDVSDDVNWEGAAYMTLGRRLE